ncbi:MAG: hypothetical protein ACE5ES_04280 [Candidatus Nanoarchaeia archaeon]
MTLKVDFNEEFERKFRELAMRKYGFSKGSIKKASKEAIKLWIKGENEDLPEIKDSIGSIRGIIKNVKNNSVGLQHEASRLWIKTKK